MLEKHIFHGGGGIVQHLLLSAQLLPGLGGKSTREDALWSQALGLPFNSPWSPHLAGRPPLYKPEQQ